MKRILVVDDDPDILDVVKLSLTFQGFNVETMEKWEDIPERIMSFAPELLLLDVYLVGADGRNICKKLKETSETKHIPVVLFSANPEAGSNFRDYHAEAFLAKPFNISNLLSTITNCIK